MASIDDALAKQAAILVDERVLRRVIKQDRQLRGIGVVPHERCYVVSRDRLATYVAPHELAVGLDGMPARVVLVTGDRSALTSPARLGELWRSLFHANVHLAFEERLAAHALTAAGIRERIDRIGQTEFDEIRAVVRQEDLLLPPITGAAPAGTAVLGDDASVYIEFAALYLELAQFAPAALERTFPALTDPARVEATLALDVDALAVLARTRPPGAPDHPEPAARPVARASRESAVSLDAPAKEASLRAALRARDSGNRARAAILHYRGGVSTSAEADLAALVARLQDALAPTGPSGASSATLPAAGEVRDEAADETAARWAAALAPVAVEAARQSARRLSVAARLLHDLQAACVVADREVKAVDVLGWAMSLGKRALVRPLPATREVRIAKHIRAAVAKIPESGVPSEALTDALHDMETRAEANVRRSLRPKIEAALDQVELHPRSLPERVGEKKLIDELLDRAVTIGRLSIGNLRDAISKNDLKVADLTMAELKSGDQLLRADELLARSLDGVYRRGEGYLRALQRMSSVMFGTAVGRFLTLYLLLPLLGALAVMEGLQHMVGPLWHKLFGYEPAISTRTSLLGCALFLFLLIHLPVFRRVTWWLGRQLWRVVRLLLFDLPLAVWRHPLVVRVLASGIMRWGVRPALPAALAWWLARDYLIGPFELRWVLAGAVFVVAALVSNSRFGRVFEERLTDWVVRSSRHLTTRLVPGLVKWLLSIFVRLIELFDRGIYRVDGWLRFRTGESRVILVVKGALGTVWGVITFVLRLYINLFVEPTVNPIKHFPVVTVAAKLIIPIIPALLSNITTWTTPLLGSAFAGGFAGFTVIVLPGLAGFLVWELKENWRMYRSTRPKAMRALAIGHHGETMVSLLKPGFHAGTIPKLFTRLRRAAWRDDERGVAKQREGLHHVEESVAKFVDRQLVSMLNEISSFTPTDVALVHVDIGSNRVQVELACPSIAGAHGEVTRIRFELQSGWVVASIAQAGWIDRLDADHRRLFEIALTGFYKLSGVDIVREQVEAALRGDRAEAPHYDLADDGLVVWPGSAFDTEVVYDLRSSRLVPRLRDGSRYEGALPDLGGHHALFGREPLYWSVWATAWQQIARDEQPMALLVGPSLLPVAGQPSAS